ncbi:hypothetical protein JCGZ_24336 [Jatropha curcas]|uniref:Uncharacterized protein n=1 Tax=Jatropha curcas TaxID=180498 RepID=A0A067L2A1_JATCU|nr:hypothetical protein JCGZ_24336 [Jatropha curcas]
MEKRQKGLRLSPKAKEERLGDHLSALGDPKAKSTIQAISNKHQLMLSCYLIGRSPLVPLAKLLREEYPPSI